jgi:hypothetical protein
MFDTCAAEEDSNIAKMRLRVEAKYEHMFYAAVIRCVYYHVVWKSALCCVPTLIAFLNYHTVCFESGCECRATEGHYIFALFSIYYYKYRNGVCNLM